MAEEALVLPPGPFSAYLFDLDGTVADTMPLHFQTWSQAVMEHGGTFPEDLFYAFGGIPLPRTVEMLNEQLGYNMPPEETARRKEQLYLDVLKGDTGLRAVASVLAVIQREHGRIPFAIVSGSPHASIEHTLVSLGLRDKFDVIVGAEDYSHGKPDPEPFLIAAARLGVQPGACLVFEDADAGIAAAEAAGMAWVRIPHTGIGAAQ
jgi:beta-phosphoglucomutase-like phosphatase (HAD superfamily)